jgi:hypothetical protein
MSNESLSPDFKIQNRLIEHMIFDRQVPPETPPVVGELHIGNLDFI